MFLMHCADHFVSHDLEGRALCDGGCGSQPETCAGGEGLFPYKIARRKQSDGSFLADLGNDSEFGAALLQVEDGIRGISLGKEVVLRLKLDSSPQTGTGQK